MPAGRVPALRKAKKRGPKEDIDLPENRRMTKWYTTIKPNLDLIKGWIRKGYTEESICQHFGLSQVTFWGYKKEHPELVEAIEEGKRDSITLVENALFRECTGYDTVETKEVRKVDENGEVRVTEEVVTTKHIRPSPGCITFFLTNRDPDRWQHVKHQISEGKTVALHLHGEARGVDLKKLDGNQLGQLETLLYRALGDAADMEGDDRSHIVDVDATVEDDEMDLSDLEWDDGELG